MGEGLLPGGVFRQSAPGEFEINIPWIAESSTNKIIRRAYFGKQKGSSTALSGLNYKYPLGFTPPEDFIVSKFDIDPETGYPREYGVLPYKSSPSGPIFKGGGNLEKARFTGVDILPYPGLSDPIYTSAGYNSVVEAQNDINPATKDFFTTNPEDPTQTIKGKPRNLGNFPNVGTKKSATTRHHYNRIKNTPFVFFDAQSVQFRHLVEFYETEKRLSNDPLSSVLVGNKGRFPGTSWDFNRKTGNLTGDVVSSFIRTHDNNEDPTILGFDVYIRIANSPLFNGTIERFIEQTETDNVEIRRRLLMLDEFKRQILGFFKIYKRNKIDENLPDTGEWNSAGFNQPTLNLYSRSNDVDNLSVNIPNGNLDSFKGVAAKSYYIQSIQGLDKLNEQYNWGTEGGNAQTMVNYGTDYLKITMTEDVSQNMGYLASLYKNLTWSRERGRLVFPENLLRFELVIDITEIRKYARVYQDDDSPKWNEIADFTSKYRYFLHDCQLFFPKMPHGDILNNSVASGDKQASLDMNVFYKHTNLRFMKFNAPTTSSSGDWTIYAIDNTTAYDPAAEDETIFYPSQFSSLKIPKLNKFDLYSDAQKEKSDPLETPSLQDPSNGAATISRERNRSVLSQRLKLGLNKIWDQTSAKLKNAGQNFINANILAVASLLNRTLNEIYNTLPVVGGIPPPKNIYTKPNEWEQAYLDFIGPGLKTFFENPLNFRKEGDPGQTLAQKVNTSNRLKNLGVPIASNTQSDQGWLDVQFGVSLNEPQKYPNAVKGTKTLSSRVLTSKVLADFGVPNVVGKGWLDVGFGPGGAGDPQKYPNAVLGIKKLQTIVDSDPNLGNGSGISRVPFLGNRARRVNKNRTLKQIVDSDPNLGNGSGISRIPFLGNRARTTTNNQTSNQKVWADPNRTLKNLSVPRNFLEGPWLDVQFGIGGSDPQKYPVALLGTSKLVDTVSRKSIVSTFDIDDWNKVQFPAAGQKYPQPTEMGSKKLNDIVEGNPELGTGPVISQIPYLGNRAPIGNNLPNSQRVFENSKLSNTSTGNSATLSSNDPIRQTVKSFSTNENPQISNQGLVSRNLSLNEYTKYSGSKLFGTVDWGLIQFPNSAQRFPPPKTEN
jgi:hypothetical protein